MLFHVHINVTVPHDIDPQKLQELSEREHERAKDLQLRAAPWPYVRSATSPTTPNLSDQRERIPRNAPQAPLPGWQIPSTRR